MPQPSASLVRAELQAALAANTNSLQQALLAELAQPITLAKGRYLQFEIDPCYFGIHSCETEGVLFPPDWLEAALPGDWLERAEVELGGWNEIIEQELCPWFADCWESVGGPARFSPAYLFFHGFHMRLYDLARRHWLSAKEAFGKQ